MSSPVIAAFSNAFAPEIWTESRLARALNIDGMKLSRAYHGGRLRPDFVTGRTRLYRPSRAAEIAGELSQKLHPQTHDA